MMGNWARNTFEAFGNRNYLVLWIGTTLAFLAFMMSSVVQAVVAFDITGRNGSVGAVSLGMGVATILISPFGGVVADRVSKRRLLLVGQTIIGLNFAAVGVLIASDQMTIPLLAGSTFVLGAVFSFIAPARQAWIGEMLPGPSLANGIALQQLSMTMTRIVGPFLAGGLVAIAFVGPGGTYVLMALLFCVVVATLAQLPASQGRPPGPASSVFHDFKQGLAHVLGRRTLGLLAGAFIGITISGFSYQVVLPGFLENELGRDPKEMSLMLGVGAIAGLAATVALAGMASTPHAWKLMLGAAAILGAALVGTGMAANLWLALVAMLFVGAGSSAFQLLNSALVMQASDPAYYGRVMSVTMLAWGLNGMAGLPFGMLADRAGEREALVVMGLLVVAVALVATALHAGWGRQRTTLGAGLAESD